jgi:hypothetical protein
MATALAPQDDGEHIEARDFEGEARQQGWKPLDEFSGDPDKHKSAEQFVKDGEEKLSLSNARVKHLTASLEAEKRRGTRLEKDFEAIRGMMTGMEKRAYDRAMGDLKAQQEAAVESGDVDSFKAIGERMETLRKDAAPEETKPKLKYEPAVIQRKYADFLAENEWFDEGATGGAKKAMTIYAGTVADELGSIDDYDGTPDEYFKALSESVKDKFAERYPKLFGAVEDDDEDDPKPKKRLSVEGVSSNRGGRSAVKTAAHLDQAAREQGNRFVTMGIFPNLDAFAKEYFANA